MAISSCRYVLQSLKILAQVVVSEAGGGARGGSPVLLATMTAITSSSSRTDNGATTLAVSARSERAGTSNSRKSRGRVAVMAVVLTAFDRKLYLCPGHLSSPSIPSAVHQEKAAPLPLSVSL